MGSRVERVELSKLLPHSPLALKRYNTFSHSSPYHPPFLGFMWDNCRISEVRAEVAGRVGYESV